MKADIHTTDLNSFEIFSTLSDMDRNEMERMLFKRTYKKNQLLFTEGDPRERIFLLKEGYVKLEKTNVDATMLYINYIKPRDIFPYVGLFTEDFYRYSAYALTDIDIYYIPTKHFESLIRDKNDQLYFILKRLDLLTKRHQDRLQTISTSFATDRVEQSISYLVQNFSDATAEGYYVDIPMTMTELAKIAGTTRETVSHVCHDLQDDGIMSMKGKHIIIHDMDYFMDKSI